MLIHNFRESQLFFQKQNTNRLTIFTIPLGFSYFLDLYLYFLNYILYKNGFKFYNQFSQHQ